jgi:hypothetical protein
MLAATRRAGLIAFPLPTELGAIMRQLAGGHPVDRLAESACSTSCPRWHYALVVGYDLPRHELILRSGTEHRLDPCRA